MSIRLRLLLLASLSSLLLLLFTALYQMPLECLSLSGKFSLPDLLCLAPVATSTALRVEN